MPNNRRGLGYIGAPGQVLVQRPALDAMMDWENPSAVPDTPWQVDHDAGGFRLINFSQLDTGLAFTVPATPYIPPLILGQNVTIAAGAPGGPYVIADVTNQFLIQTPISGITGFFFTPTIVGDGVSALGTIIGIRAQPLINGAGLVSTYTGVFAFNQSTNATPVTISRALEAEVQALTSSSITTGIGLDIIASAASGGTIGTMIGVRAQIAAGTTRIGGLFGSPVAISSTNPAANPAASTVLDLQGVLGALKLPSLTTAQKNALTAAPGMLVYDSTLDQIHGYTTAGGWAAV